MIMEEIKEQNILPTETETVNKSCCGSCGKKINCWKGAFLAALLFLAVSLVYAGYQFSKFSQKPTSSPLPTPTPIIQSSPTPTTDTTVILTPTPKQENGVDLKDIKYQLPQDWTAKLNNDNLFISPVNGGGFLSIKVYNYSVNVGRREYYCQVSKVCIEGTSYFTEMNIGNISGYVANALDNSGGGPEYFGAKGNKFYIVSSYNPPSPNEFEKNYKNILNSLIF